MILECVFMLCYKFVSFSFEHLNIRSDFFIAQFLPHWFGDGSETNFSLFGKSKEENSAPNSKSNSHSGPAQHNVDNRSPFPACQSKTLLPEGKVTSFFPLQLTLDHNDPSKPSHRLTNGPEPSKTIESDGSNIKKPS